MVKLSSHLLDSTNGTHASGIAVSLAHLKADGARTIVFEAQTDAGGRLVRDIDLDGFDPGDVFELVFETGPYWDAHNINRDQAQIISQIVHRLTMADHDGFYHLPIIISPNGYSCWWSG